MPNNTGFNPLMPTSNLLQPSNDTNEPGAHENKIVGDDKNLDSNENISKLEAAGADTEKNNPFEQEGEEDNADLDELLEIFKKSDPEAIKNLVKTLNNSELKKKLVFVIEEYFPNLIHLLEDHESNKKDSGSNQKNTSSQQNSNEKISKGYDDANKGPQYNSGQQNPINQGQFNPNMIQNPGQMQFMPGQIPGQFGQGQMPGQFGQGPPNNFIIQQGPQGQQFHGSNMGYQGHKRGSMNSGYQGNNSRYQGRDNYRNNNNNYHRNQRGGGYMGNQNNNQGYNKGRHGNFRQNQDFDDTNMDQHQTISPQGPVNNFQPMFMDQQQGIHPQIGNNKPQFLGMPQGIVGQDSNQGQGPVFQDANEIQPVQGMIGGIGSGFPVGFQGGPLGQGITPNQQFGFMGQQNPVSPSGNTGVPGFLGNLGNNPRPGMGDFSGNMNQAPGQEGGVVNMGQGVSPGKANLDNTMISGNIGMMD